MQFITQDGTGESFILKAPRIPPSPLPASRLCNDRPRKHRRDHRASDHGTGDHGTGDHGTCDHGTGDHGEGDHGTGEWLFSLSLSLWQRVHYIEGNESIRTFFEIMVSHCAWSTSAL